jgi:hypothetical protein
MDAVPELHGSLKNFVYQSTVRSVDVEAGVIIQCGKPGMIGGFGRDCYQFRLVTEVKENDVYFTDGEKLDIRDTEDEPFQVWHWDCGQLTHAGCTDLEHMTTVPSILDGDYITPGTVSLHNKTHLQCALNELCLGGYSFRDKNQRESFRKAYVFPPFFDNYIKHLTAVQNDGGLRSDHYLSDEYDAYLRAKMEKKAREAAAESSEEEDIIVRKSSGKRKLIESTTNSRKSQQKSSKRQKSTRNDSNINNSKQEDGEDDDGNTAVTQSKEEEEEEEEEEKSAGTQYKVDSSHKDGEEEEQKTAHVPDGEEDDGEEGEETFSGTQDKVNFSRKEGEEEEEKTAQVPNIPAIAEDKKVVGQKPQEPFTTVKFSSMNDGMSYFGAPRRFDRNTTLSSCVLTKEGQSESKTRAGKSKFNRFPWIGRLEIQEGMCADHCAQCYCLFLLNLFARKYFDIFTGTWGKSGWLVICL